MTFEELNWGEFEDIFKAIDQACRELGVEFYSPSLKQLITGTIENEIGDHLGSIGRYFLEKDYFETGRILRECSGWFIRICCETKQGLRACRH